jgi:hypothetical protein
MAATDIPEDALKELENEIQRSAHPTQCVNFQANRLRFGKNFENHDESKDVSEIVKDLGAVLATYCSDPTTYTAFKTTVRTVRSNAVFRSTLFFYNSIGVYLDGWGITNLGFNNGPDW